MATDTDRPGTSRGVRKRSRWCSDPGEAAPPLVQLRNKFRWAENAEIRSYLAQQQDRPVELVDGQFYVGAVAGEGGDGAPAAYPGVDVGGGGFYFGGDGVAGSAGADGVSDEGGGVGGREGAGAEAGAGGRGGGEAVYAEGAPVVAGEVVGDEVPPAA